MMDLTGLKDGGTAGDIIGKDGSGVALEQVTTANQGTVFGVTMTCLETDLNGGSTDIDLVFCN